MELLRPLISIIVAFASISTVNGSEVASRLQGNITVGGLVPIHPVGSNGKCNYASFKGAFGLFRLEAMIFSIGQINKNKSFHPVNLGLEVRDSCNLEAKALEESLNFVVDKVPDVCQGNDTNKTGKGGKLAAVIGATKSSVTAQVAKLLRLFKIPQISYASTSDELSDKSKYDFLLRTVPSDKYQAKAMADYVDKLQWKAVYGIYEEGNYGRNGMDLFKSEMKRRKICMVDTKSVTRGKHLADTLRKILVSFSAEDDVTGIVLFCHQEVINTLIDVLKAEISLQRRFNWVGSDGWGIHSHSGIMINATVFALHDHSKKLDEFKKHCLALKPGENNVNPWFDKYWCWKCAEERKKRPDPEAIVCPCNDLQFLDNKEKEKDEKRKFHFCANDDTCFIDDKIVYVIDAVYAVAHALKKLFDDKCPGISDSSSPCIRNLKIDTTSYFKNYLSTVSFQGLTGKISFDENTLKGAYDIYQMKGSKFENVGMWYGEEGGVLKMNKTWRRDAAQSYCGVSCPAGSVQKIRRGRQCCWDCIKCEKTQKVVGLYECQNCAKGYKANESFDGCVKIKESHWDHGWLVAISFLASVGCGLTIFVFAVFLWYSGTPVIRAASREISYTLLLGIILCYSLTFFMAAWPSPFTCGVLRFGTGFSSSLCYAALLVKTSRIARIFSGRPDPLFITPKWQLVLTGLLVMPQALIGIVGLLVNRPKEERDYSSVEKTVVRCSADSNDLMVSMAYNILLIIMCTYYAFRTRKVPENFNEARFIVFVMYTTCVIWLAFLPFFYSGSTEYRSVALCLNLILNSTTLLLGLFGIKMYIVLLRPEKNIRANSKARSFSFPSELNGRIDHDLSQDLKEKKVKASQKYKRRSSAGLPDNAAVSYVSEGPFVAFGSTNTITASSIPDVDFRKAI